MKPANPRILTINGGSSSIKFALYRGRRAAGARAYGKIDRIGLSGTNLTFNDSATNQQDRLAISPPPITNRRRIF